MKGSENKNLTQCNAGFFPVSLFLAGLFLLFLLESVWAACIDDISNVPMVTKVQSAPANVMFVLDNSGSMDWEFMTSENDGIYKSEYYLYPDSAFINGQDRAYDSSRILDSTKQREWKSQWAGYNKIFYDPNALYSPWPKKSDADTAQPWSNPNNTLATDSKFNMTGEYFSIAGGGVVEVIVDNRDAGFSLSQVAAWNTASNNGYPHYDSDYYFTSASFDHNNDWASWTPGLPGAGDYKVAVWWTHNDNRDTSVYYEVNHNDATSGLGPYNMQNDGGQWNDIGTFYFKADGTESVKLTPDISGQSRYSADAVKFYIESDDISIKNAHYFVINDLNKNGTKDAGEDIFLVNFVSGVRAYYLFDDDNTDDRVDDGELYLKTGVDIPAGVKASIYDDDGVFERFATDAEDLQNFANWFSFYRKRELTAKAAVAGAIHKLDWVYVGFYSINAGLRQEVLPIEVETADPGESTEIVVDNKDSGYIETGLWKESSAGSEYSGSSRYTKENGGYATFTPDLPSDDTYKVYVWYTKAGTRDTNAKYTVHHANGDFEKRIDQQKNYGDWVELGEFTFTNGTSGYVRVTRDNLSTGTSTSADAVKFVITSAGASSIKDESDTLLSLLYDMDSSGNTPLRTALNNVGRYFHKDDGNNGNLGDSPFALEADGGACQQAFAIVMTDGFWNGASPGVDHQDQNTSNVFDGPPWADDYSNTLADVAMKYYKNDLANTLDDVVPTNSCDKANHQHMVTYGVSFGVTGTLDSSDYDPCLLDGSAPPWPSPEDGDQEKIDDLFHATVNGRGLFFSAANPQELVQSLVDVTANIASRISSGASVSVNGEELNSGTTLYQASYSSDTWTGDVTAFPVDPDTGEIKKEAGDVLWHASDQLQLLAPADRNIVTYDPVTGTAIEFAYANLNADQKTAVNSDEKVVRYVRGEEITDFRSRNKKLSDIIHSAPLLMGDTIYAGGNDGMLHAFNATTGQERFAYIPDLVMHNYKNIDDPGKSFYAPGYEHRFFVDLTPAARKNVDLDKDNLDTRYIYLVGGLGKGGKGYYCLDITQADEKAYTSDVDEIKAMVKWEYPQASTPQAEIDDLGYSFSMPIIVRSNIPAVESTVDNPKYKWVIIFGNGYGSNNGSSLLYILDLDGTLIRKIDTGVLGCNGLSTPSVIDVDNDTRADYAYAGDLKGNLWKFDLTNPDPANWEVAHKNATFPTPFFSVPGKTITSKPDVMRHCEFNEINADLNCNNKHTTGYMIMFGTGKYLNEDDRISTASEYVFGLWDYGDDEDDAEYLGTFDKMASPQLSNLNSGITLLEQIVEASGIYNGAYLRVLSENTPVWKTKCDSANDQQADPDPDASANAGWFFELTGGERIIKDVIIRDKKLIYLTFTPDASPCSGGGSSIIHEVNACTGGRLSSAQFDINNDSKITDADLIEIEITEQDGTKKKIMVPPTGKERPGLLHIPVFIRFPDRPVEMKIFSTSASTTETLFEVAEPRGLFYWISH